MTAMQEQSLAELAERIDDLELPFMRAVQFAQGYLTLLAERDALKTQLEGVKAEAVVTAFEALINNGYFLHTKDGDAVGREGFCAAITTAIEAALR